jgi:hypothetical protein
MNNSPSLPDIGVALEHGNLCAPGSELYQRIVNANMITIVRAQCS